jgi:hypothetical protein
MDMNGEMRGLKAESEEECIRNELGVLRFVFDVWGIWGWWGVSID